MTTTIELKPIAHEINTAINLSTHGNYVLTDLEKKFISKGYTTGQLIILYDCSYKTWRTWIDPYKEKIGQRSGHKYKIPQIQLLVSILGFPDLEKNAHLL
jgi:hypothetical protein